MKTALITLSLAACLAVLGFTQPKPLYVVRSVAYYWGQSAVAIQNIQTKAVAFVAPKTGDVPQVGDTVTADLRPAKK